MQFIGQIILGLLMVGGALLLLKYNYQVSNNLRISFAEERMGPGGSYLLWKIFAILLVFIGFSVMFGVHDEILGWIFSPLTRILNPGE